MRDKEELKLLRTELKDSLGMLTQQANTIQRIQYENTNKSKKIEFLLEVIKDACRLLDYGFEEEVLKMLSSVYKEETVEKPKSVYVEGSSNDYNTARITAIKAELREVTLAANDCRVDLTMTLAQVVQELKINSDRYLWLRKRLEVRDERMMNGELRKCIVPRIGCSVVDRELPYSATPERNEQKAEELDTAIDAVLRDDGVE